MFFNKLDCMAKASYEQYFEGLIGCCEEPYDSLPEEHKERLRQATAAGTLAGKKYDDL